MKNHNYVSPNEKSRILEMYYSTDRKDGQITEQKLFSGIKAGIKGFGRRVGTNIRNVIKGAQGKRSEIKNPRLERDIAKLQSRASDLISTIEPFVQEIIQTKIVINSYPQVYGQEYVDDAKQVVDELTTLESHIGNMRRILEEFKSAGQGIESQNQSDIEQTPNT